MLFNSIEYAIFLPVVFFIYWILLRHSIKAQNILLLVASYVFYGWWDYRFLTLIVISSITDYLCGKYIYTSENIWRKVFLILSLVVNLGILAFFKYFNFFVDSFIHFFAQFDISLHKTTLQIILPVGISFYTFQTLSYTLDIYYRKIKPTQNIVAFFSFVSFFPQLVAGPIERARNLLPQFETKRNFNYTNAKEGLKQIVWGLFKKIVIADRCAFVVDRVFENYAEIPPSALLVGVIFFAFQIYGDFSGYSDIAIGSARLLGFKLMRNFAYPYFARNIGEFWHRWHISLSTWFRDYVYIPLGGSRVNMLKRIRNIIITFTISGLWHGANWTFVFWGFLHSLYYIPGLILKQKVKKEIIAHNSLFPKLSELLQVILTFSLVLIAWIFFRSQSMDAAFLYIYRLFSPDLFLSFLPGLMGWGLGKEFVYCVIGIILLILIDWYQRNNEHGLYLPIKSGFIRYTIYFCFMLIIFYFRNTGVNLDFIYFQF